MNEIYIPIDGNKMNSKYYIFGSTLDGNNIHSK